MNTATTLAKILVVEDEPRVRSILMDYLRAAFYDVESLDSGERVVDAVKARPPDLIVMDLMLPGIDGIEVCRQLRCFSEVPIIIVTARTDEANRLVGLGVGADDYICKPFSPREVVARARAILRRAGCCPTAAGVGLKIDKARYRVEFGAQVFDLTPVEFKLLEILADAPGRVFTRQQLLDRLHDDRRIVTDRTVDTHIKNLRRKLQCATPGRELIRSVYGVGYKLGLRLE